MTPSGNGAVDAVDLLAGLTSGQEFMRWDSTVVRTLIPNLAYLHESASANGTVEFGAGVLMAASSLDAPLDFDDPAESQVGAAWLWNSYLGERAGVGGGTHALATPETSVVIDIKASRRFRENDSTLWLVFSVDHVGATVTGPNVQGFVRLLIRVP